MSIAIALEFLMKFYLAKKHFLTNREISDEDKIKKKNCYDLESIQNRKNVELSWFVLKKRCFTIS